MKKIKKFLLGNIKPVVAFILGIIISGTTVYAATILFNSNQVGYDNTSSGMSTTNVQDTLDELYTMAQPPLALNSTTATAGGTVFLLNIGSKKYACNSNIDGKTICVTNGPANNTTDYNARVSALQTACTAVGGSFSSNIYDAVCYDSSEYFNCVVRAAGNAFCTDFSSSPHGCAVNADGSVQCD